MNSDLSRLKINNEEDTFDTNTIDLEPNYYYGNYKMIYKINPHRYLFAIGPHLYISIVGKLLVLIIGLTILAPLYQLMSTFLVFLYLFILGLVCTCYLAMFLKNPGIVSKNRNVVRFNDEEGNGKDEYTCRTCLTKEEDGAFHCYDCNVCIKEHDHHCIWVGKCVGGNNLILFYIFVGSIPLYFVFVMVLSVYLTSSKIKSTHH